MMFVLDPLFLLILDFSFCVLFAIAAAHKIFDQDHFKNVLIGYDLIPHTLVRMFSVAVPMGEIIIASLLLIDSSLGRFIAVITLLFYALLMASAILRNKVDIDCGCSWGGATPTSEKKIGWTLVGRNFLLIAIGAVWLLPVSERIVSSIEYTSALAFIVCATVLAFVTQALSRNHGLQRCEHAAMVK